MFELSTLWLAPVEVDLVPGLPLDPDLAPGPGQGIVAAHDPYPGTDPDQDIDRHVHTDGTDTLTLPPPGNDLSHRLGTQVTTGMLVLRVLRSCPQNVIVIFHK